MAVTKIHPIKTTLKKAIDYICDGDKTGEEIYASTHLCSRENAHKEFELTKREFSSKTKTLAHHLIQSFAPNEVSAEEAHQVGVELCDTILGGKYEYVIVTHIDKENIHNHIIFNSVDIDEGKVYKSYYVSYMRIRNESDRLCNEHHLSVIDNEKKAIIDGIKNRKFKNWYDWSNDKKGKSYKSKLQFNIDRAIKTSLNYEHFLSTMKKYGYEIKEGKYIAFKEENQKRFTRAKTIGENYTEDRIRKRIKDRLLGNDELEDIIDVRDEKIKAKMTASIYYDRSITNKNMQIASKSLSELAKLGLSSTVDLESELKTLSFELNERRKELDDIDTEIVRTTNIIKDFEILSAKKPHFDGYKKNPNDKIYMFMNGKDVDLYQSSYENVDMFLKQFPHIKNFVKLGKIDKKTISKLDKHISKVLKLKKLKINEHNELVEKYQKIEQIKNNLDTYLGKDRKIDKKLSWIESVKLLAKDKKDNRELVKPTRKKSKNDIEL